LTPLLRTSVAVSSGPAASPSRAEASVGSPTVEIHETSDIARFRDDWERLFACPGNEPSTSYEWTASLVQHHLVPGDDVFVARILRGGNVVALVPLVARRYAIKGLPVRTLFPISERYKTHSGVLAASLDQEIVSAFVRALYRLPSKWDVFRLADVLDTNPLLGLLQRAAPRRPLACQSRRGDAGYVLDLPRSMPEYLSTRSAKFRNYLRRVEKKLERGRADVVETNTPLDAPRGFEMLLEIERGSWKHANGTAVSAVPRQRGFYRELCIGAAAAGRLHLQLLLVDGQPAAYNLGYLHAGAYHYLKTSYQERFKPLGVATFLRARLIDALIQQGCRRIDFPAEPYEWERQWTDECRWHTVFSIYRGTPIGCALAAYERLRRRSGGEGVLHPGGRARLAALPGVA
jgi:CelD/BcsL family acetyltransferase involved in cellulose biosynthesis